MASVMQTDAPRWLHKKRAPRRTEPNQNCKNEMFCKIWITQKETSENKGENQQQTKTTYQVASGNEKPIKLLSARATNAPLFHTARVKVQVHILSEL